MSFAFGICRWEAKQKIQCLKSPLIPLLTAFQYNVRQIEFNNQSVLYPAHSGGSDEPLSVQVAITKLELKVGLAKVKSRLGAYVWKVRKH